MFKKFFSPNLDLAGAITAGICAVHCMILPILISFGISTQSSHDHTFDFGMMIIGMIIAGYVQFRDYQRHHKSLFPMSLSVVGFIILFLGIETHGTYFMLNILGGGIIIISHIINWKLSHSHTLSRG